MFVKEARVCEKRKREKHEKGRAQRSVGMGDDHVQDDDRIGVGVGHIEQGPGLGCWPTTTNLESMVDVVEMMHID